MRHSMMDQEKYLKQFQGSRGLARSVAKAFLDSYQEEFEKLQAAFHRRDSADVERWAHSLKGALSSFFADSAVAKAMALEIMARSGHLDGGEFLLKKLKSELDELSAELRELVST